MQPLRVGIIGGGRWAQAHAGALESEGHRCVGALVATEESRQRLASSWAPLATTSLPEFLAWQMDAVIVASPNHLHAAHARAALKAGLHVLVEKPMCLTVEDCEGLEALAREQKRVLANGLEMRAFTLFSRIHGLLEAGRIGRVRHLGLHLWRKPHRAGSGGWRADVAQRGPPVLEEPIHYLDLARWFLGDDETVKVHAFSASRPGREALDENLDIVLEQKSGAKALITRSLAAFGHRVFVDLVGDTGVLEASWEGAMDADLNPRVSLTVETAEGREEVSVPSKTGHAYDLPLQLRAFVQAIRGEGSPVATGEDGTRAVALCWAVEKALRP